MKYVSFIFILLQIQFVLYETHSELEAENETMVNKAMKEINRIAKVQHATLQGKISVPPEQEVDVRNLFTFYYNQKLCFLKLIYYSNFQNKEINNNETLQEESSTESIAEPELTKSQNSEEEIINNREKIIESINVSIQSVENECSNLNYI